MASDWIRVGVKRRGQLRVSGQSTSTCQGYKIDRTRIRLEYDPLDIQECRSHQVSRSDRSGPVRPEDRRRPISDRGGGLTSMTKSTRSCALEWSMWIAWRSFWRCGVPFAARRPSSNSCRREGGLSLPQYANTDRVEAKKCRVADSELSDMRQTLGGVSGR